MAPDTHLAMDRSPVGPSFESCRREAEDRERFDQRPLSDERAAPTLVAVCARDVVQTQLQ
jgi:hypothetical protein